MKVLVACEFSGIVRDAFLARGHDAFSCDIILTERPCGLRHRVTDVRNLLDGSIKWDLMIAHPPCTDLAVSGARYFREKQADGRQKRALDFVQMLMDAPIEKICIENPVSIISSRIRKPDQIIQPWMFGHFESKLTCLWLKNLPKLQATNILEVPENGRWNNQTSSGQNKLSPSKDRWKERSRTYQGIANAMAEQWGCFNQ